MHQRLFIYISVHDIFMCVSACTQALIHVLVPYAWQHVYACAYASAYILCALVCAFIYAIMRGCIFQSLRQVSRPLKRINLSRFTMSSDRFLAFTNKRRMHLQVSIAQWSLSEQCPESQ